MGEIIDKVKGKAKQVGGILTGNKGLQTEGQLDEAKGAIKGIANKLDGAVTKTVDKMKQGVKKV